MDRARDPDPAAALADGLAAHLRAWALGAGAAPEQADDVARLARALSRAIADGHVCLPLDAADAARLRGSGAVGTPEAPGTMPLIVDAAGRLYLHRGFDDERALARRLMRAARAPKAEPVAPASIALLRTWFGLPPAGGGEDARPPADGGTPAPASAPAPAPAPAPGVARADAPARPVGRGGHVPTPAGGGADAQALAVALALRRRLLIVSGGPGTGKTSTVVALLGCLLAAAPALRVALAAPTGKAAARLAAAVRERGARLPEDLRARLPAEAATVHRLLGAGPRGFAHDAANPLPIDLLVVDEASMLDLALARRLFDAVPEDARIVLLGDQDQLAAVEAGAVFAELSGDPAFSDPTRQELAALCGIEAAAIVPPPPRQSGVLPDATVWFTRNYRFAAGSGIGRLADAVRRGEAGAALAALGGGDAALRHLADDADGPAPATWQAIADGHAGYLQAVQRDPGDPAAIAAAFDRFRVLCALRDGPRGVQAVNRWLDAQARRQLASLHAAFGAGAGRDWPLGRPVMVLRNDPLLRLANGDIGFVLPAADGRTAVHFAAPEGGFRALPPQRLPPVETAYATTVHQAQGSEFDAVLLLLPARPSRVLTRELLYTAVTRARERVIVAGPAARFAEGLATPTRRSSGLLDRLREAARAADR